MKNLIARSGNLCELCGGDENLQILEVEPRNEEILICQNCAKALENPSEHTDHFRCLGNSMWSEIPAVQVVSYRTLKALESEDYARDLLDMMYLEDDVREWALSGIKDKEEEIICKDSNGTILKTGDSVSLIKDLEVKGAGFTAKRGTAVKNILLTNNPEQIEAKINGMKIILLSKFLKKI